MPLEVGRETFACEIFAGFEDNYSIMRDVSSEGGCRRQKSSGNLK